MNTLTFRHISQVGYTSVSREEAAKFAQGMLKIIYAAREEKLKHMVLARQQKGTRNWLFQRKKLTYEQAETMIQHDVAYLWVKVMYGAQEAKCKKVLALCNLSSSGYISLTADDAKAITG